MPRKPLKIKRQDVCRTIGDMLFLFSEVDPKKPLRFRYANNRTGYPKFILYSDKTFTIVPQRNKAA